MNDDELIDLLTNRSDKAIAETQKEYGDYLYSISFRVVNNKQDAEECVNDSLLKIWHTIPPLVPTSFKAYIGTIVRNISLDCYRKQKIEERKVEFTELLEESYQSIREDSAIEILELSEIISKFLEKVGKEKRFLFLGRYYYGYTISELAKKRNYSESKVKTTLFRMRNELKKQLRKDGVL